MKTFLKRARLLGISVLMAGCVSVEVPPPRTGGTAQTDPLIVARIGDAALLSWNSSINNEYTVVYADGRRVGADWRPLPGAVGLRGTGREMRIEDQMPADRDRHYRLMISPVRR